MRKRWLINKLLPPSNSFSLPSSWRLSFASGKNNMLDQSSILDSQKLSNMRAKWKHADGTGYETVRHQHDPNGGYSEHYDRAHDPDNYCVILVDGDVRVIARRTYSEAG